jgi:LysM repeat protein
MRLALLLASCILLISGVLISDVAEARQASTGGSVWVVRDGETLTSIAKRHRVKVSELKRWNRLVKDAIRPGDTLHIRPTTGGRTYRIRKGETLGAIAKRERVSVEAIVAANPGLKPSRIRSGQEIDIPGEGDPPVVGQVTTSKGAGSDKKKREPSAAACPGRVVQLRSHPGYRLRSKEIGFTTAKSAEALKRGFDHVLSRHKNAPRVNVLDASRREGGQLGGHRSHQTGHDVDITYYQRRCPAGGCPLKTVTPSQLDVKRQWTLISYWLKQRDVVFVLVDYDLQRVLYEHAKKRGVSEKTLREWFQYPRPKSQPGGLVRHWESHRNHVHVRFKPAGCPGGCCRPMGTNIARRNVTETVTPAPPPAETAKDDSQEDSQQDRDPALGETGAAAFTGDPVPGDVTAESHDAP